MKLNEVEEEYYAEKINEAILIVVRSDWNKYFSGEKNLGMATTAVFDKIASPLVYLKADLKKEKKNEVKKERKTTVYNLTEEDFKVNKNFKNKK